MLIWPISWCDVQSKTATTRQRLRTVCFVKFKPGMLFPLFRAASEQSVHIDESFLGKHFRAGGRGAEFGVRRHGGALDFSGLRPQRIQSGVALALATALQISISAAY